MQHAQRQIAARHVAHDDAKAVDIEHLGKSQRLAEHLAVNAVEVLFAAGDIGLDAGFFQLVLDRFSTFSTMARRLPRAVFTALASTR